MLSPEIADIIRNRDNAGEFAGEIGDLSLSNVFGALWTRPGLDRRARSLVTLGILIALRAEEEIYQHIQIAVKNGLTVTEIEEVIYHATGYAGFPAGNSTRGIAMRALRDANVIE